MNFWELLAKVFSCLGGSLPENTVVNSSENTITSSTENKHSSENTVLNSSENTITSSTENEHNPENTVLNSSESTITFSIENEHSSGTELGIINGEKLDIKISHNEIVGAGKSHLRVGIELLVSPGLSNNHQRLGADIVLIFDVGCFYEAFEFFIDRLTPMDQLSVIKASANSEMLCPLHLMASDAQNMIRDKIKCQLSNGDCSAPDIAAALKEALQVLNHRNFPERRKPTVLIFSSRKATRDVTVVPPGDVAVHTFAFGFDSDHEVLQEISSHSNGGTFSILNFVDRDEYRLGFTQCLTQLSKVVLKELEVILTPIQESVERIEGKKKVEEVKIKSIREQLDMSTYPVKQSTVPGCTTLSLGCAYTQEKREIGVNLSLPAVEKEMVTQVLQIAFSYSDGVESYTTLPSLLTVHRSIDESLSQDFGSVEGRIGVISRVQNELIHSAVNDFNNLKREIKPIQSTPNNVNKEGLLQMIPVPCSDQKALTIK